MRSRSWHAPAGAWAGEAIQVLADRGNIATAVGQGEREVLSQVAFHGDDVDDLEPGTV
jgi:hypothetical protein